MKLHQEQNNIQFLITLILMGSIIVGCAASGNLWGDPESGLILNYRFEEGKDYKYMMSNKMGQELDMMGQKMSTSFLTEFDYSLSNKNIDDGTLKLNVTINNMDVSFTGPQGETNIDASEVNGKTFSMMITKLGREFNFENIDSVTYQSLDGRNRGVSSNFQMLFPNLSATPVKVGGSWSSVDSLKIEEDNVKMLMVFSSTNNIIGIEQVNGFECAKISSEITGILEGNGNQGGMKFTMKADLKGNDTWHFAFKEGLFVKSVNSIKGEGEIASAQMNIPFKLDMEIQGELIN